jgi:hypothetical protein
MAYGDNVRDGLKTDETMQAKAPRMVILNLSEAAVKSPIFAFTSPAFI